MRQGHEPHHDAAKRRKSPLLQRTQQAFPIIGILSRLVPIVYIMPRITAASLQREFRLSLSIIPLARQLHIHPRTG